MTINQRIKRQREHLGLSQAEFARLVGVSTQSVQQWEQAGGTSPRRKKRAKLAEVLRKSEEWLEFGDRDSPAKAAEQSATPYLRDLSAEAVELAIAWDQLGEERKSIYRPLIFNDAILEKVLPKWLKFGTPNSPRYADLERKFEREMVRNKHQLTLEL